MDAAMDYHSDRKKHSYNPLICAGMRPEDMKELLAMSMGNVTQIFEQLPLVQDVHLLRNILYGGVWQQYSAKYFGKEKNND